MLQSFRRWLTLVGREFMRRRQPVRRVASLDAFVANPACPCGTCRRARGELPMGATPFDPIPFPPAPVGHANWKRPAEAECACVYCVMKRIQSPVEA